MNKVMMFAVGALGAAAYSAPARADVKLNSLFADNMVLQRDKPVPVWGTATPGERVTVAIGAQQKTAVAAPDGRWMLRLDPLKVATSLQMRVTGSNALLLQNVAVGDVYICSGQSNMEYSLQSWSSPGSEPQVKAAKEVANSANPNLRLFQVPKAIKADPQADVNGQANWQVSGPTTSGGFSAVGYFFGRELQQKLNVPIGLIGTYWGGTYAEAWTSRDTLGQMPEYKPGVDAVAEAARATSPLAERMSAWWQANDPGTKNGYQQPDFDDKTWKTATLPGQWETNGLPDFDGVVWYRRAVDVPANLAGQDLTLHLGAIDDRDTTFWNGVSVGETNAYNAPRNYTIPGAQVKAGRNVISVRVLDTGGGGGFSGGDEMRVEKTGTAPIALTGAWSYATTAEMKNLAPAPASFDDNPNQPTVLYNGMIAPLVPFAIRGAIWYQGESNAGNPVGYRTLFPSMIRDWRSQFGQGDFGFYFVQLANFLPRAPQPNEGAWAELREAQSMTLALPKTGMATIIDVGEAGDIHPTNKLDVGHRLALAALADTYAQPIEYSGPMFQSVKPEGNTLRVRFSHAQGLKTSDGAAPLGFIIAGATENWAWATAKIDGDSIVLSSDAVPAPTRVRYAWANNPPTNLYNAAGLPAVPFRSDAPPAPTLPVTTPTTPATAPATTVVLR